MRVAFDMRGGGAGFGSPACEIQGRKRVARRTDVIPRHFIGHPEGQLNVIINPEVPSDSSGMQPPDRLRIASRYAKCPIRQAL
jgi:hypothetical protein